MPIQPGRPGQRLLARLLVAALIVTSPGFNPYQAFALAAKQAPAEVVLSAHKAISSLPTKPVIGRFVAYPQAGRPIKTGKLAPAKSAAEAPLAKIELDNVAGAATALRAPNASEGDLHNGSAQGFETLSADRPSTFAPLGTSSPGAALRPAGGRGIQSSMTVAVPGLTPGKASTLKERLTSALPKLSVVAGVVGLGWLAHAFGKPELLAGVLPAFMMGTLSDRGGSSGSHGDLREQVYKEVASRLKAGQAIYPDVQKKIAKALRRSEEEVNDALVALADQNKVALLGNDVFLATDIPDDGKLDPDPLLANAHALALRGLQNLNRGTAAAHAQALHDLTEASKFYESHRQRTKNEHPSAEEVGALAGSARFELMRDVFKTHDARLANLEDGVNEAAEQRRSAEALDWLKEAYYDVDGHVPKPLSSALASWMYKTFRDSPEYKDLAKENPGASKEIAQGLRAAESYLESQSNLSDEDKAALRKPATGRRVLVPHAGKPGEMDRWFDLIGPQDGGYAVLNEFGKNLARAALDGEFPPYVGTKAELDELAVILGKKFNNNPLIIGESGAGKTARVQAFQQAIINGDYPEYQDVNIFELDLAAVVAGTKYRGEFEQRLKNIIDEVKRSKGRVLLLIDEAHMLNGAGDAEGALDAGNILKGPLVRGELRAIGATTPDDLEKSKMEDDAALMRRWGKVRQETPTPERAVEIVRDSLWYYEKAHGVKIPAALAPTIVKYAERYLYNESLLSASFTLVDTAASRMKLRNSRAKAAGEAASDEMTVADLATEATMLSGEPVGALNEKDYDKLYAVYQELTDRIIGQDHVVQAVGETIIRARLQLKDPKKPFGIMIFLGPTGVGKTELAKAVAAFLFGSEKKLVRLNMSDYSEAFSKTGISGAPAGYVGYEEGGKLTKALRRNPYSVVLLDEMEKADPSIYNTLLAPLDDGEMNDAKGRRIKTQNHFFIMTGNLGTREFMAESAALAKKMGFAASDPAAKPPTLGREKKVEIFKKALAGYLPPEAINRIGPENVMVFDDLERQHLQAILKRVIANYNREVLKPQHGLTVALTEAAEELVLDQATTAENAGFGARPLERTFHRLVGDAVAKAMMAKAVKPGDKLTADVGPETNKLAVTPNP